jgi:hypothetical protein
MRIENQIKAVLDEFSETINLIAGVFFDATQGFGLNVTEINRRQRELIQQHGSKDPEETQLQYLDSAWILYGQGDPNDPKSVVHHQTTQEEFKIRNSDGGSNHTFIGNMALIAIYQYWEDHYRKQLADIFGVPKSNVESDVFGEMNILRNSIIHHGGIAKKEIRKCKRLNWFKAGELIRIDNLKFLELLNHLKPLEIRVLKPKPANAT